MKVETLVSVLFGLASAQTTSYYLGDDYIAMFNAGGNLKPNDLIGSFYLKFATTKISFIPAQHRVRTNNTVTLKMNFGTTLKSLKAPATVSGMADLVAVRDTGVEQTVVRNINVGRHIQTVATSGEVLKVGATQASYLIEYNGNQTTNLSNPASWVVQLAEINGDHLMHYDSFTVNMVSETKVSPTLSRFTLFGTWANSKVTGKSGLYFMVGAVGQTHFNNYAVTGNAFAEKNSWVVVDANFKVNVPAMVPEYNATQITMNGGGVESNWWLMATDEKSGNRYVLSCSSMMAKNFGFFEWAVMSLDDSKRALSPGKYLISAIWTSHLGRQMPFMDADNPSISISQTMDVVAHGPNAETAIAFSTTSYGKNLGGLSPKQNITVNVFSVFKTVYLQWFKQAINHTNSTYGNITSGWKSDGPMYTKTFTPGTTTPVSLLVPEDVLTGIPSGTTKARLYGWAEDCNGSHFASQFIAGNLTFPPAPNTGGGSSKLGAGAIVGIVCAVVFVCGVAAWWLCMKNNGGTDRYQKLDGH